jgi:hydrogenase maturation protein HypF
MIARKQIQVRGIVQSVGFRPFVYGLAQTHGLHGRVCNNELGVLLDLEGPSESIDRFVGDLRARPPSLAQIEAIDCIDAAEPAFFSDFQILRTVALGQKLIPVSADVAPCSDCLRELFDPANRRFRYPFINCTNCGPRFTIIEDVPYDRANTTMRDFEMCRDCRAEYENPRDRRFHAEPTACATCGPNLSLFKAQSAEPIATAEAALAETVALLRAGKIIAIKGIGGFHLACDAINDKTVRNLRQRKYREEKPFALMASSVEMAREYCHVSAAEQELLLSVERPIVLLPRRKSGAIAEAIAPRISSLGFMLPYSPLHHLLFETLDRPLVMTSANISDEPICYRDDDAHQRLQTIADYFLIHNRRIHMRTDDSVLRVVSSPDSPSAGPVMIRRSRGYAPAPVKTAFKFQTQILACGAELKSTFCLAHDNYAFISPHIGDLENLETLRSFTEGIAHFKQLFYLTPEVVAYDLHPEYLSTKYALALDDIESKIAVQHHHAHVASCMADNQIEGEVIGIAMDGLGFGTDRRLWGGEFLIADFREMERFAHLNYIPMPGGASAIREPWRMAAVYLQETFGDQFLDLDLPFVRDLDTQKWKAMRKMASNGTNSPQTSSMGRLFDAVASLLRLRDVTNYEGQAAIELEQIAAEVSENGYQFEIAENGKVIRAETIIRSVVEDLIEEVPPSIVSARFHAAVANLILTMVQLIRDRYKLNRVVMSGGVFQNLCLLNSSRQKLSGAGFEVFTHNRVPTNDGGICLGQAAVANAQLPRGS